MLRALKIGLGIVAFVLAAGGLFRPLVQGWGEPQVAGPGRTEPGPRVSAPPSFEQLLPRDAIRPVYDPSFVPAHKAQLRDDELVLGVALNGEAKAYPVGPLNQREIVNDTVGGVPVLVTW